ncbi:ATP-binding cassette, subfamily C, CydC [Paenibacillus sp. yr247]|uniref:amino acid ABC transporter ATP-binding/permease protein n=1 Tax=Paenibacillus sp. yr247 TaxID=1761880 RepID=UPI0008917059|nr:hypothetical protein [Paenibacillus sp. yr247]SDP08021.1 ATP-binding cassette, subfamily C, CydC [Paenibacillus sp. yr247]
MSTFRRILLFMKPYRLQTALAIVLGFLTLGANIGLMGTSGYLIASAALHPETILLLWLPIVGVRFFGLSRGVFRYLERLVSHDLTFRILSNIRVWLYGCLEPRGADLLEKERSGDVLGSVICDVDQMQNVFLRVISPPIVAVLTMGLGFGVLAWYDLRLGYILVVMMLAAGLGVPYYSHKIGRLYGMSLVKERAELFAGTSDLVMGLSELIAFGRADEHIQQLEKTQLHMDGLHSRIHRIASGSGAAIMGSARLAMWLVLLTSIPLVFQGKISGVALPTLMLVTVACFEAVTTLPAAFQNLGQTLSAGLRLFRLADQANVSSMTGDGHSISSESFDQWRTSFQTVEVIFDRAPYNMRTDLLRFNK